MFKKIVMCCLCSALLLLNSMDQYKKNNVFALNADALIALSDEQLGTYYAETQKELHQVQNQIAKVRACEAEKACLASSACLGALGVGQHYFGCYTGAAYVTSFFALLGGLSNECCCEKPDKTLTTSLHELRYIEAALKAKNILLQRIIQKNCKLTDSRSGYRANSE